MNTPTQITEALGESDNFLEMQESLSAVAKTDRPVLLIGERGTGKELAAQRIHFLSSRWNEPLITLNCAALSPSLLESELFGHESGSFTGATKKRKGRFEMADKGTLFLDEIAQTPFEVQEKILRVIEYQSFERVGSSQPISVDVRIIGATNANLEKLVEEEKFKADLLDRLAFEVITLPPLRFRQEDILLLANQFANRMSSELGRQESPTFSEEIKQQLINHDWPGNIRELKNTIERSVYKNAGSEIEKLPLNPFESKFSTNTVLEKKDHKHPTKDQHSLKDAVFNLEKELLNKALIENNSHQQKSAEALGLSYHQFRALYRKHKKTLET